MALTIGTKTANLGTPGATTQSFSHDHSVGSDGYLFVIACMSNVTTFSSCTYNGVSMTELDVSTTAETGMHWVMYELAAPATGSNTVELTFAAAQYNPVSCFVISATDCAGSGNLVFDNTATSPNAGSITVSADSMVFGALVAGSPNLHDVTIDGSSRTLEYEHNVNNRTSGALSATGLSAGSITTSVAAQSNVAGYFLEIQQAGGGGGGASEGNFLAMF